MKNAHSHKNIVVVLTGTTAGMLVEDAIGIIGGAWMCRHMPEKYIKWVADLTYLFGVKYTYNGQTCDIILANKETTADINNKIE